MAAGEARWLAPPARIGRYKPYTAHFRILRILFVKLKGCQGLHWRVGYLQTSD